MGQWQDHTNTFNLGFTYAIKSNIFSVPRSHWLRRGGRERGCLNDGLWAWTIKAKRAISFGLCIKPIMKVKTGVSQSWTSSWEQGEEADPNCSFSTSIWCQKNLVSENRIEGGSPEDLAESIFPQYLFLFSFGFGPVFTQKQNCIVKVNESLPHLKSTSKSWAVKQRKMCLKARRPETRNDLFKFSHHESDYCFFPFPPSLLYCNFSIT